MTLRIARKCLNDAMGPIGIFPTLLVSGMLPRLPVADYAFPNQQARMRALAVARSEMETVGLRFDLPKP